MNPTLTKCFTASVALLPNVIVRLVSDNTVALANSATANLCGITADGGQVPSGGTCEVVLTGIAEVIAAGTIAAGAMVTSNASGAAVAASAGNRAVGMAIDSAVSGDIFRILVAPSVV